MTTTLLSGVATIISAVLGNKKESDETSVVVSEAEESDDSFEDVIGNDESPIDDSDC